jgi:hypothetical protein
MSGLAMPTAAQIEQQRQTILARLRQYGYPPQQLSDQQVLATMTNIPQQAVQYPQWVQDWYARNPQPSYGGRPGVDTARNPTYEDFNLRTPGMSNALTEIGSAYGVPMQAMYERYGTNAVERASADWVRERSSPYVRHDIRTDYMVGERPNYLGVMPNAPQDDVNRYYNMRF